VLGAGERGQHPLAGAVDLRPLDPDTLVVQRALRRERRLQADDHATAPS
jgi:hypothetical protein